MNSPGPTTRGGYFSGIARRAAARPQRREFERCDLCGAELPSEHWHALEAERERLICICQSCKILFGHNGAARGALKLLPTRRRRLAGVRISEQRWAMLGVPVSLAFFVRSPDGDSLTARYPSPAGITEAAPDVETWRELEAAYPELRDLEPAVEAVLVRRRPTEECYLVPIDDCFRLAGIVRTCWQGMTGGAALWEAIDNFFERVSAEAVPVGIAGA